MLSCQVSRSVTDVDVPNVWIFVAVCTDSQAKSARWRAISYTHTLPGVEHDADCASKVVKLPPFKPVLVSPSLWARIDAHPLHRLPRQTRSSTLSHG